MKIKLLLLFLVFTAYLNSFGQFAHRFPIWYIPSKNIQIHGLAIGPFLNNKDTSNYKKIQINGLNAELIGLGFMIPVKSAHPYKLKPNFDNDILLDYADSANYYNTVINGINLSSIGTFNELTKNNGINISGMFSYVGKVNGFSFSLFSNMARELNGVGMAFAMSSYSKLNGFQFSYYYSDSFELNGVQTGIVNKSVNLSGLQLGIICGSIKVRGLQIGVINYTDDLKGLQIGLFNINKRRQLPFFNFNFN